MRHQTCIVAFLLPAGCQLGDRVTSHRDEGTGAWRGTAGQFFFTPTIQEVVTGLDWAGLGLYTSLAPEKFFVWDSLACLLSRAHKIP